MGTVFFVAVLALQVPVTVPGNITVVPRVLGDVCNADDTLLELAVGKPYEVLIFVDAMIQQASGKPGFVPNQYQEVGLWIHPPCCGVTVRPLLFPANDEAPVCPTGTINAGMRPHLIPIPPIQTAGVYVFEGTWIDRVTPSVGYAPAFAVTVK